MIKIAGNSFGHSFSFGVASTDLVARFIFYRRLMLKVKKINQYCCDFCGKKNYSAGHMKKHEKHCTMNPNRKCRMCELVDVSGLSIKDVIQSIPELDEFECSEILEDEYFNRKDFDKELKPVIVKLREQVNNCPACILAVLRQSNIFLSMVDGFSYKEEIKQFWSGYNEVQRKDEEYLTYLHGFI